MSFFDGFAPSFALSSAPLLILLSACSFYASDDDFSVGDDDTLPGDDDSSDDDLPSAPDCTEEVLLPPSLLSAEPAGPADPHQDVVGAAPTPFNLIYGWPSRDPSRSASFLWRTDLDTLATVVEYGVGAGLPEEALTERTEGYTFTFGGSDAIDFRAHEVKLCGRLQPGTAYSYRVGGEGAFSPIYTFTTPGEPGTFDTFRVAISGDSRGAYDTWGTLLAAMEAHSPDFYLFSGDVVDFGTSQDEWDAWFAVSQEVFPRKAFIPAHGNHEFLASNYFAQFSLPGIEEWFSVDFGTLHVVSLNDTVRSQDQIEGEEASFLDSDLAATSQPWKFVMHHQPAYSTCTTHGSNETVREAWSPIFEQRGVQMVTSGHNHIYERSVPILAGAEVSDDEGVVYLVSGGAGADLYENTEDQWFGAVANPIEHYVIADVTPEKVTVTAYDIAGNIIDTFVIPAR